MCFLDPYPKTTHDSSGTSISWPTSRVHHRSRQVTLTTSWLFVFTSPWLFLFLRTLLVLPESVSSKLQFLSPQINSFLNCSLCIVWGSSTFHGIRWIGYTPSSGATSDASEAPAGVHGAPASPPRPWTCWWVLYSRLSPWERFWFICLSSVVDFCFQYVVFYLVRGVITVEYGKFTL